MEAAAEAAAEAVTAVAEAKAVAEAVAEAEARRRRWRRWWRRRQPANEHQRQSPRLTVRWSEVCLADVAHTLRRAKAVIEAILYAFLRLILLQGCSQDGRLATCIVEGS